MDPEAQCDDDGDDDDGGAEEGEETAESSSTYEEYDREDEDGVAIPLDEDNEIGKAWQGADAVLPLFPSISPCFLLTGFAASLS